MKHRYFPGLNGIRAIAALMVIFSHFHSIEETIGITPTVNFPEVGKCAVTMFFVLSGFLITYQLLVEKQLNHSVSLKKFYLRRLFRIWPLYYLIIILTILIWIFIPEIYNKAEGNIKWAIFYYAMMVPNLAFALEYRVITTTPLWSVGVEEQFYSFWPLLFKYLDKPYKAIVASALIYFALKIIFYYISKTAYYFWVETRIDCMAIGGLGAYWVFTKKEKILKVIFNTLTQVICWSLLFYTIIFNPFIKSYWIAQEVYAVIFLVLILNVAANPNTLISLENKILNFLGKISYGMYLYHMFIMALLGYFLQGKLSNSGNTYLILCLLIFVLTMLVSHLSFKYFESYFLALKDKWAKS